MSRGFVKEANQEEVPIVSQRAHLPEGVTNFVTRAGLDQLLTEKQMLCNDKDKLSGTDENEKRIAVSYINAKLHLQIDRIAGPELLT